MREISHAHTDDVNTDTKSQQFGSYLAQQKKSKLILRISYAPPDCQLPSLAYYCCVLFSNFSPWLFFFFYFIFKSLIFTCFAFHRMLSAHGSHQPLFSCSLSRMKWTLVNGPPKYLDRLHRLMRKEKPKQMKKKKIRKEKTNDSIIPRAQKRGRGDSYYHKN